MKVAKRNRNNKTATGWHDLQEAPAAATPTGRKMRRRARRVQVLLWVLVLIGPLAIVSAWLATDAARLAAEQQPPPAQLTSQSRAQTAAYLNGWLANEPEPIPGGVLLGWEGADQIDPADDTTGANDGTVDVAYQEVNHYSVADAVGRVYTVEVTANIDSAGGVTVAADPSLFPVPQPAEQEETELWPGWQTETLPSPVRDAIVSWASAWTSGNANQVQMATGDGRGDVVYPPLAGVAAHHTDVQPAGVWVVEDEEEPGAEQVVARVAITLLWGDEQVSLDSLGSGDIDTLPQIELDVLVARAGTASPAVVAWGTPGTGPHLEPYDNAVDASGGVTVDATTWEAVGYVPWADDSQGDDADGESLDPAPSPTPTEQPVDDSADEDDTEGDSEDS